MRRPAWAHLSFALLFLFAASAVRADFDVAAWRFKKDIIKPAVSAGFGEILFDSEVFASARANLSDIRIVDENRIEVPYILATEAGTRNTENYDVRVFNKGFVPEAQTAFSVDLGREGALHNRIEILTNSLNFRRTVRVEGSVDQTNWIVLADKKSIYDYTVEFKAKDTGIFYPESTYRYLRVTILDNGEKPIEILGARVSRDVATPAREVSYGEGSIVGVEENQRERSSVFVFDVGAKGLPTDKLILGSPSVNFNREIALEGSNDMETWSIVLWRDVLFSYQTPKFQGNKLTVSYPEVNYRYFRLTVFNKDDQPIRISDARFSGLLRKLIFQYDPLRTYALYYGYPTARFPEYDLKNYVQYLETSDRVSLVLSKEITNTLFEPPKLPSQPLSEQYPYILNVTLVLVVLVLGFFILRLFKKVKK